MFYSTYCLGKLLQILAEGRLVVGGRRRSVEEPVTGGGLHPAVVVWVLTVPVAGLVPPLLTENLLVVHCSSPGLQDIKL